VSSRVVWHYFPVTWADRQRYAQERARLYRREGITLADGLSLAGALIQLPVFLGIYQVLRPGMPGV